MYIAIEGIDGVGKSTQLALLQKKYPDAVITKEPGGTPFGQKIREMLLNSNDFSKETEMLLFLADRAEHRDKVITPALKSHKMLISDRSFISGIAYANDNFSDTRLLDLNHFALQGTLPDKVIFLYLSQEQLEARFITRNESKDHIEKRGFQYLISVQNKMQNILQTSKLDSIQINADQSIEKIHQQIKEFIND
jgi:dTMP kinase